MFKDIVILGLFGVSVSLWAQAPVDSTATNKGSISLKPVDVKHQPLFRITAVKDDAVRATTEKATDRKEVNKKVADKKRADKKEADEKVNVVAVIDFTKLSPDPLAMERQDTNAAASSRSLKKALSYTVRGKTYHTLAESEGFTQEGKASWYGPGFHGRKTASGEIFDMNAFTAAHKELPMGTRIEVTNLNNGKSIVVRVNDRGPFHGNRVLDLSRAAAKELGVIKSGTAKVSIRALQ